MVELLVPKDIVRLIATGISLRGKCTMGVCSSVEDVVLKHFKNQRFIEYLMGLKSPSMRLVYIVVQMMALLLALMPTSFIPG